MQRPDCFTVENARNVLVEKSCSFSCVTPTPTPCIPVACDGTEAPRAFDINGDCRVTAEDAEEVLSYLSLRTLDLDQEFDATYDANGSGTVTSLDSLVIMNFMGRHQCDPTPTPTATPTPTPIPAGACLTNNNETRFTSAGVLEYYLMVKSPADGERPLRLQGFRGPMAEQRSAMAPLKAPLILTYVRRLDSMKEGTV